MAKKNTQVDLILRNLDSKLVAGLYEIAKDKDKLQAIKETSQVVKNIDMKHILDNAGGVNSMDRMIDKAIDSSFYRGGISRLVLLYALIINAEKEMERREAKS